MLRSVLRSLVRQPSFAATAIGTLALGIAASSALFSTVNAVLLRPLPYQRPADIYTVRSYFPSGRFTIGLMASEEMSALAGLNDAVARTAMAQRNDSALLTEIGARQVTSYVVSGGFFDLFGVPMERGRAIGPAEDVKGAPSVAVLSHALWMSAYGGRADIIDRVMTLGSQQLRVVGVAPASFNVPSGTDVWVSAWFQETIGHGYEGYVRLKPGVTVATLSGRMQQIMDSLGRKYPDQELGRAYRLRPLLDATVGDLGPIVLMLFGATALLLVLAAVNVSNLVLVRGASRAREFAVRAALGASRLRIARQVAAEALLLAACGGVAGGLAGYGAVRVLGHYGGSRLPRVDTLVFDARVFGFIAALVLLTAAAVAIVPALRMADRDIAQGLNETGRSVHSSRRTRRLLGALVIAEIAVAVALVAAGGRLLRSYDTLARLDPGFDSRGRLVLDVLVPPAITSTERYNVWRAAATDALRQAGAEQVASASSLPLQPERDSTMFGDLVSRPDIPPEKRLNGRRRLVSPEFFKVMGIGLLAGRPFLDSDIPTAPGVAIVNEAFVRRSMLHGADPLRERLKGLHFRREGDHFVPEDGAIVGVVSDTHYASPTEPAEPTIYLPLAQYGTAREQFVVTTPDGAPDKHVAAFRAALMQVDPRTAIESGTMSAYVAASLERQRLGMWLMSAFGIAALILATVGVSGVVAYVVSQRRAEIAVRQALGATARQVVWMVMREGAAALAAGVSAGLLIAMWIGQLVARYVYGVRTFDALVLTGSAAAVTAVVFCATLVPASRAALSELSRGLRPD